MNQPTKLSCEIDFLPEAYHEAGVQRKNITLRVVVVMAFLCLIGFAAIYQQHIRIVADGQLNELLPLYERAQQETKRLAQLQQLLQSADKQAELCTYLRHPWPRSQIVAALVKPLPDEVELKEISIVREPIAASGTATMPPDKLGDAAAGKVDSEERDLVVLREQGDKSQVVVKLSGVTDDALALHRYFGQLDHGALFVKVDVGKIEQTPNPSDRRIQFTARVFVRPGYGQPDGPTPVAETTPNAPNKEGNG